MKLCLVIDSLGSGGAQRQIANLGVGLKERSHDVEFFVYHRENHFSRQLEEAQVPVWICPKAFPAGPGVVWHLRQLIQRQNYDVIVSFLAHPNALSEMAVALTAPRRRPGLVVSERSAYPKGVPSLGERFLGLGHWAADAITVNSVHQRLVLERTLPWARKRLQTIYNGCDLNRFCAIPAPTANDPIRLLSIGSVVGIKNPFNLARAMAICRSSYGFVPRISWVGKTDISRSGAQVRQETDRLLTELHLTGWWEWIGELEAEKIPSLLRDHDALIHPSFFEGLPNAICEALACARPVLASNVCDHPRLVEEGASGFLFDPNSPESIATAMQKFARLKSSDRQAMGEAARRFAENRLGLRRFIDEYEELLESICIRRVKGRRS